MILSLYSEIDASDLPSDPLHLRGKPRISLHRRGDRGWISIEAAGGESLSLDSLGIVLRVEDVYREGLEDAAP